MESSKKPSTRTKTTHLPLEKGTSLKRSRRGDAERRKETSTVLYSQGKREKIDYLAGEGKGEKLPAKPATLRGWGGDPLPEKEPPHAWKSVGGSLGGGGKRH